MRNCIYFVLFLILFRVAVAQPAPRLPAAQSHIAVEIKILEDLSSQTLRTGQSVAFQVDRDVIGDDGTLIPAGTPVTGEVTQVKAAGSWEKSGSFDLILRPINLADGSIVQLDFYRPTKLSGKKEKTAVGIVTPFVLFYYWPLIPIGVVQESRKHGQAFTVRAGERYVVYIISREPTPPSSAPPSQSPTPMAAPSPGSETRAPATQRGL